MQSHLITLYGKEQPGYLRINLLCSMEEITNFLNYELREIKKYRFGIYSNCTILKTQS